VELGGWAAYRREDGRILLNADGDGQAIHLELEPAKPLAYHGQEGYAQKDADSRAASFYCSYPRLNTTGRLVIDDKLEDVKGLSWMDHEKLTTRAFIPQSGWERLLLQLATGEDLMIFKAPGEPCFAFGSWIDPDGAVKHLIASDITFENNEYWISPTTGARYPLKRKLSIESLGLEVDIKPAVPTQEMDATRTTFLAQWGGIVSAQARYKSAVVDAQGYMQIIGQDARPRAKVFEFLARA
jgi:predicted secreted hydrolase